MTFEKIAVTDGVGFIASNLMEKLHELNNEVVCLDNFAIGRDRSIQVLITHPEFEIQIDDV